MTIEQFDLKLGSGQIIRIFQRRNTTYTDFIWST